MSNDSKANRDSRKTRRNIIKEIKESQERFPDECYGGLGHMDKLSDLQKLEGDIDKLTQLQIAAIRNYMVVNAVAVLQSTVKDSIREVIDYKERHGQQLPSIDEKILITLDLVREFSAKSFSIGEFVAHITPCNSYEQIESNLKAVCDCDLRALLIAKLSDMYLKIGRKERTRKEAAEEGQLTEQAIKELFVRRNIICHEVTSNEALPLEIVSDWLWAVHLILLTLTSYQVRYIDFPSDVPRRVL